MDAPGSLHEGLDPTGPDAAEETIVGPYIFLRGVRLHRDALDGIVRSGVPRIPGGVRTMPDGRVVARVMPTDLLDRLAYLRVHADVWMDRTVTAETLPATMATAYRTPPNGASASCWAPATHRPSARWTRSTSCSWSGRWWPFASSSSIR